MSTQQQAPVWAREEVFPAKPTTGVFGFQDTKGKRVAADSQNDLIALIKKSKHGVELVWARDRAHMVAPEELHFLRPVLSKRRSEWAHGDIADGKKLSLIMGAAVVWAVYSAYVNSQGDWRAVLNTPTVAITMIMLLIFGLVPWYEGWKELKKSSRRDEGYWQKEVEDARFDSWLSLQRSPFTFILLVLMLITGVAQWYVSSGVDWSLSSLSKVALLKQSEPGGDVWWRYFTAPMAHGNLVHWVMNFAGLRYLAKRTEALARWPQMILVFLVSAFVGGMATVHFAPAVPSVGASGGILGLLGFLLVFETLHKKLVPKTARKRLLAGIVMVAAMGLLGFGFIDNAAHAGGAVAGMIYATIVFPFSSSAVRPEVLKRDVIAGVLALLALVAAAVTCAWLVLA